MFKTLIHCALLCEAQALINYYKLSQHRTNSNQPTHIKIYTNDALLIVISGIGKINTQNTLEYIKQYANNIYLLSNDDLVEKYSHLSMFESFSIMNQTIDEVIKTGN